MGVRPAGGSTMGRPVPKPAAQSPVAIGPGTHPALTAQRTAREAAAKALQGSGNNPQNAPYRNVAPRPTQSMDNYVRQDAKTPIKPLGPNAKVSDPGPNAKASLGKGYAVNARTQNLPVQGRGEDIYIKGVKPFDTSKKVTPSSPSTPMMARKPEAPTAQKSASEVAAKVPQTQQQPGAQAQQVTTAPRVQSKMGSSANINTPVPGKQGSPSGPAPERPSVAVGSSGNDTISKSPAAAPARSAAPTPRPRPQARARPAAPAKETTGDIMNRMWVKESFESFLRNNFLKG